MAKFYQTITWAICFFTVWAERFYGSVHFTRLPLIVFVSTRTRRSHGNKRRLPIPRTYGYNNGNRLQNGAKNKCSCPRANDALLSISLRLFFCDVGVVICRDKVCVTWPITLLRLHNIDLSGCLSRLSASPFTNSGSRKFMNPFSDRRLPRIRVSETSFYHRCFMTDFLTR